MISIIDAFNSNSSLSFTLSSSEMHGSSFKAEYGLNKEGENRFESVVSNAYWQISFSQPVSIKSYIISGQKSWFYWPTSWEISYSLDDSSPKKKQIDKIDDLRGNTNKFPINPPIYCKHFKITGKTHTNPNYPTTLAFYRFDCFGSLKRLNWNTLGKNHVINQFLRNLLISIMIHFSS